MNKITIALIASLLCQSCLWIDKIIPPKEYDWEIDTHHTIVTSDHGATINAIGDNIPNGINWSSEPNDIVRLTPVNNGKCCHIDYIRDGEGIITATYDTKSENCEFKSQIYSSTGLHLKINGTDRYFPLIEHNGEGDGISKITRKFVCSVPKDTLKNLYQKKRRRRLLWRTYLSWTRASTSTRLPSQMSGTISESADHLSATMTITPIFPK